MQRINRSIGTCNHSTERERGEASSCRTTTNSNGVARDVEGLAIGLQDEMTMVRSVGIEGAFGAFDS